MDFAGRSCVLPECHSVPRSKFALATDESHSKKAKRQSLENPVYRNVSKWNHTQSLSEFTRLGATFLRPEVAHDRALLGRVFYRNWNQHRTSVYYRRLSELRRGLRIVEQAGVRELIERLGASFYEAGVGKSARKVGAWQALPCAHYVAALAARVSWLARLAVKMRQICWSAFMHFGAQTAQTLFMPLALVVQGIAARLFVVFGVWQLDLVALYELLVAWQPALPACPDSLGGLTTAGVVRQLVGVDVLVAECAARSAAFMGEGAASIERVAELSGAATAAAERQEEELDAMDVDLPAMKAADVGERQQQLPSKKRARQRAVDLYADDDDD
ncbi:hypothetical protein IWW37_004764 [Coemansia sp. RSA 2050]|nr:hypothetical protein IWW37_004764 [Coemansia sp. RSA 2050]KAJ2733002.1 hypothetical protein IW152_003409 [Coemansia sp. BCRC 34962]